MGVEARIQLLLIGLSLSILGWNLAVLYQAWRNEPFKSRLAQARALTRGAVESLLWIVRVNVAALVFVTLTSILRNYYTLPTLEAGAPAYVQWLVGVNYVVAYAVSALPATLTYFVILTLKEHDEIVEEQIRREYALMTYNNDAQEE